MCKTGLLSRHSYRRVFSVILFFFFFLVMLDGSDVLEPAVVFTATKLFLNGIFQLFLCQMDYKNSISTLQVKAKFFWVILQA